MTTEPDSLFSYLDGVFIPTALTTGPWSADAMHGGPPSALAALVAEAALEPDERVARINIELERPVPLVPLTATSDRRRVSGRVTHVWVALHAGDELVLSARALALREQPLPVEPPRSTQSSYPLLDDRHTVVLPEFASGGEPLTYHRSAVEHRMPPGSNFDDPGAATSWVRLRYPLLAGELPSGLQRVLAAADFGSGISALFGPEVGVGLINADLSVALTRPTTGEWVRIASETRTERDGAAMCVTELGDQAGAFGVATQSLLAVKF